MSEQKDAATTHDVVCRQCGAAEPVATLICTQCQAVLPSQSLDPFSRLGLPITLTLDDDALNQAYRRLMALVHPDRYRRAVPQQQQDAFQHATDLSQAVRVLRDPLMRIESALAAVGQVVEVADAMDPESMMLVFQLSESLEQAESVAHAQPILEDVQRRCSELERTMQDAFSKGEWMRLRQALSVWRSLRRLLHSSDPTGATPLSYRAADSSSTPVRTA